MGHRIGVDLGGTKIEIVVLDPQGSVALRRRIDTPPGYDRVIAAIAALVRAAEQELGIEASIGVGIPGVISPATGLVKNANSQALIGHALDRDLSDALRRPVRVENDANCFALSEAIDGAGAGYRCVFGVILGTGCGGGIVVGEQVLAGRNRIAGEWGHTPLPWPRDDEWPQPPCWCGQAGCLELYLSGPGFARTFARTFSPGSDAPNAAVVERMALAGDPAAIEALERHADRLARGLAVVMNVLDPDVIVLGGGLSKMPHLYERVPALMARYIFSDTTATPVLRNHHGDSSGVRGAAWLWPPDHDDG